MIYTITQLKICHVDYHRFGYHSFWDFDFEMETQEILY